MGFALVSLAAFSVWGFGGKWFQAHTGEAGLYGVCAFVFVSTSGLVLSPLVFGPNAFWRFYEVFIPAFLAYAVVWCASWFAFHFGLGEWLGSLLGTSAFTAILAWRFRATSGLLQTIVVLFCCHTAGYLSGGRLMYWLLGPTAAAVFPGFSKLQMGVVAKLSWGLLYGFGFGAGIGYAFNKLQCAQIDAAAPPQSVHSPPPG